MLVVKTPAGPVRRLRDGAESKDWLARHPEWLKVTTTPPTQDDLEDWQVDVHCLATDGCEVEQDGSCPHGHPSWLLALGLI